MFFLHASNKFFDKPFEFLLYKINRLHFSVCVYCDRSQKTSQRVKNNSHAIRLRLVSYFFCSSQADIISDVFIKAYRHIILPIGVFCYCCRQIPDAAGGSGAGSLPRANDDNQYESVDQEKLRRAAEANNGENSGAASGSSPPVYAVVDQDKKKRERERKEKEKEKRAPVRERI